MDYENGMIIATFIYCLLLRFISLTFTTEFAELQLEMACQVGDGTVSSGLARIVGKCKTIGDKTRSSFLTLKHGEVRVTSQLNRNFKVLCNRNGTGDCRLSTSCRRNDLFIPPVVHSRNVRFIVARNQLSSDCGVDSSEVKESLCLEEDDANSRDRNGAA